MRKGGGGGRRKKKGIFHDTLTHSEKLEVVRTWKSSKAKLVFYRA